MAEVEPKIWEMNQFGQLEGYDAEGRMVCVQKPKGSLKKAIETGSKPRKTRSKEILGKQRNRLEVPYSRKKSDDIFTRMIQGETIEGICKSKDMPSRSNFYKWQAKYPQFKALVVEAKKLRAEAMHDMALSEAMSLEDPKMVPVSKLKIDTLKWAAGVGNPNEFNPRPKEENMGNIFIIHTGIERDEKAIEATFATVKDKNEES